MFAIILAGGKGERLRPLTADRPKSMVPLGGKPILEHQLLWLRDGGVTDVVIACGYSTPWRTSRWAAAGR